jgi:hypothetical protein
VNLELHPFVQRGVGMSIEEFRSLVEQVSHLESEIQSSRDHAEALPLTLSQKLQTLRRIISEYEITIKQGRDHVNLDVLTDTEREWHGLYSEKPDAIRNQVTIILSQIESRITSDRALFNSLTSEERAWIIEKVGSFEVVKQGMNGREFGGELPLMPLSIVRQYLHRCGGGRFTIVRHSRIRQEDIPIEQEMAQAEDELIDVDKFLRSIRRHC